MEFQGSKLLRYRVVAALVTGMNLKISKIRSKAENPGLNDAEVKFLQLVAKLTTGSEIDISETGTRLHFVPGVITNNPSTVPLVFDCGTERGLGYFLEGILPVVIFGKNKLHLTLKGPSHTPVDIGVDVIQAVQLPLLRRFGVEEIDLKVTTRGVSGEVTLSLKPIRRAQALRLEDTGKVKKVRGVAFTSRVNVQMGNRASYSAKGQLHSFLPDIWVHTDHYKAADPAMGITLVGETNTGCFISSEFLRGEPSPFDYLDSEVPEDLGTLAVIHLLDEVMQGGVVDCNNQCLALLLMALASQESSIRLGRLSAPAVEVLRLIDDALNVRFQFSESETPHSGAEDEEEEEDQTQLPKNIIASCVGIGYENMARIAF
jgi:RNA 3'-terminal phosphate cyclase-like protein